MLAPAFPFAVGPRGFPDVLDDPAEMVAQDLEAILAEHPGERMGRAGDRGVGAYSLVFEHNRPPALAALKATLAARLAAVLPSVTLLDVVDVSEDPQAAKMDVDITYSFRGIAAEPVRV